MDQIRIYQSRKIQREDRRKRHSLGVTRVKHTGSVDLITDEMEIVLVAESGDSLECLDRVTTTWRWPFSSIQWTEWHTLLTNRVMRIDKQHSSDSLTLFLGSLQS